MTQASHHRSGQGRTIGLVLAGVLLAGALGGLVAVLADPRGEARPGVAEETAAPGAGVLSPSPVGNLDPGSGVLPPPPADAGDDRVPGRTEALGEDLAVFVPDGWEVTASSPDDLSLRDGEGSWAYVATGDVDPATAATAVIGDELGTLLPGDRYVQLDTDEISPLAPFGSLVSVASLPYDAQWLDPQGTVPVRGEVYAAVREDGAVLVVVVEHAPPGEHAASAPSWGPVVDTTLNLFGGS